MPRTYSNVLWNEYKAESYEYNGQKVSLYDAQQHQRRIERNLRRRKRENLAMSAAGLDTTESAAKLSQWRGVEKDFLRQTGLSDNGLIYRKW